VHVVGYVFLGLLALVVAAVLAVVVSAAPDLARYQRIRRM
jgi:hypothetical protein